jgi:hypothetical protein
MSKRATKCFADRHSLCLCEVCTKKRLGERAALAHGIFVDWGKKKVFGLPGTKVVLVGDKLSTAQLEGLIHAGVITELISDTTGNSEG